LVIKRLIQQGKFELLSSPSKVVSHMTYDVMVNKVSEELVWMKIEFDVVP